MNIDTSVILAAGQGIRLRNLIGETPKGLLKISGIPLLQRSINLLEEQGIDKVYVVTGFEHAELEKTLIEWELGPEICFVKNSDYSKSGSMESLYRMGSMISGDFLLLESDLLYERMALSVLFHIGQPDSVLISGFTGSRDEVWIQGEVPFHQVANLEKGKIRRINKKPDPDLETQGELVGISWISLELFKAMCRYHKENLPKTCRYHYEEVLSDLCLEREITYLKIPDLVWTEIDMESHFERAWNLVYPAILKKDGSCQ